MTAPIDVVKARIIKANMHGYTYSIVFCDAQGVVVSRLTADEKVTTLEKEFILEDGE
jgi:hypothetical protein